MIRRLRLWERFQLWRVRRRTLRHLNWMRSARVTYDFRDYLSYFRGINKP